MESAAFAADAAFDNKLGFMTCSEFAGTDSSDTRAGLLVDQIMGNAKQSRQTKQMKESTLSSYQRDYAPNSEIPIVTSKPGKHPHKLLPNELTLLKNHPVKPSTHHVYEVESSIEGVVFELTKHVLSSIDKEGMDYENGRSLSNMKKLAAFLPKFEPFTNENAWLDTLSTLMLVNRDFYSMITDFKRLQGIDVTSLRSPRLNYK
eukprot:scaffold20125_cov68-Skeletonema_dohrnii-CCMP3373.AAC.2